MGGGGWRWGHGRGPASFSASQLERRVKDIVLQTIQMYRTDPEKTEAEESWDYVQFQVREAPPTRKCTPSPSSATLTSLRLLPRGDFAPTKPGAPSSETLQKPTHPPHLLPRSMWPRPQEITVLAPVGPGPEVPDPGMASPSALTRPQPQGPSKIPLPAG